MCTVHQYIECRSENTKKMKKKNIIQIRESNETRVNAAFTILPNSTQVV